MIDVSRGRYWDLPWSLVSSCTRCSPGCENCWSLAMEKRFHKGEEGKVVVHPERLEIPLKRKKPTVFAVWNDLFHDDVPRCFQERAFCVMGDITQHTFLVLTKRPEIMKDFVIWFSDIYQYEKSSIWLGTTIENQEQADKRIPILLQIPAAKRFVSIEPMLSAISKPYLKNIDWVVLGGETGPHARPCEPGWIRGVRDQCREAGVPFFFKRHSDWNMRQWKKYGTFFRPREIDFKTHDELPWTKGGDR